MTDYDLSKVEQQIYNTHLRVSRQQQNKPFKLRKDFSNIEEKHLVTVKKLFLFFKKHNHIKIDDFFIAPYKIYKDESYFDIEYYTTLKAVKAYSLYQNTKLYEEPDSENQLNNIAESLKFIYTFCKQKDLNVDGYTSLASGAIPDCIVHLKEHKVNMLTLLGFSSFYNTLKQVDAETLKFILGNEVYNQIEISKTKLFASKKAYKLILLGIQKIKTKLEKDS
jgi:hypothetical protein